MTLYGFFAKRIRFPDEMMGGGRGGGQRFGMWGSLMIEICWMCIWWLDAGFEMGVEEGQRGHAGHGTEWAKLEFAIGLS